MRQFYALLERKLLHTESNSLNAASIVCAIYNVNRDTKKHPKPFTPQDFMPGKARMQKKSQSPDEMLVMVKMLNAAFGGEVIED